jgi:flagellar biosynthesis protein FlhF
MNKMTFKAENIQQAIANIKEELGSEAMILSTRKINKKPLDPYAKDMFEVEAALPQQKQTHESEDDLMGSIKEDIADIKDMISIAGFGNGMNDMVCNHFESVGVLASLLRAGVSEKKAGSIIQKASTMMDKSCNKADKIKSLKKYVMRQCMSQIGTKDFFIRDNNSGVPHVAAFVGPTGVGKTTTIAKLAAMLSF